MIRSLLTLAAALLCACTPAPAPPATPPPPVAPSVPDPPSEPAAEPVCVPVEPTELDPELLELLSDLERPFTGLDPADVVVILDPSGIEETLAPGPVDDVAEGEPVEIATRPACCPKAPMGWTFVYYLKPRETLSISPDLARCAYRKDADPNDAVVVLLDPKTNKISEVERIIDDVFDKTKTFTVTGRGTVPPNDFCARCHSTKVPAGTPPGHYIFKGREFDKVLKTFGAKTPNPVRPVTDRVDGKPYKGLPNTLAPYHKASGI